MPRKKSQQFDKVKAILYGVVFGLIVILISVLITRLDVGQKAADSQEKETRVSIGAMRYDFSSGKAVERNDETVTSLQAFLQEKADEAARHDSCSVAHYNVMLASTDETQVLLDYGCGQPGSRMFAVNEGGEWRTISPTNQFDMLGIPACEHVNEHGIDRSIAPVCVNGMVNAAAPLDISYSVR